MGVPPPYWAFAWAGGQALARYMLDNPDVVAGKRVLDFGAGSRPGGAGGGEGGRAPMCWPPTSIHLPSPPSPRNAEANGLTRRNDRAKT